MSGDGLKYVGRGEFLQGIPRRDLSAAELRALTAEERRRVWDSCLWVGEMPAPFAENTPPTIGAEILLALDRAGFETIQDIREASDEALLAVSGIGPKRLADIRAVIGTAEADSDSEV